MEDATILVLTAVGTKQFAKDLAHSLVSTRLAACVQVHAVEGVYRWKGEVCSGPEWVLAIKTTEGRYAELERHIRANHSYETPEIVRLAISGGSHEYLDWLNASVGAGPDQPA